MQQIIEELIKRKKSGYQFTPSWVSDKDRIKQTTVGDSEFKILLTENDFEIHLTSIEILFSNMAQLYRDSYDENELWHRDIGKIARAWGYWNSGGEMNPPILSLTQERMISLPDGKHRIAICKFFDVKEIPVIIMNSAMDNFPLSFRSQLKYCNSL